MVKTVGMYVTVDQETGRHPGDQPVKGSESLMRQVVAVAGSQWRRVGEKEMQPSSAQGALQP
jgi:hypothetical protein